MTMQRDGMRLTVVAGVLLIALLTLVPSQALGQSDGLSSVAERYVLPDHLCKSTPANSPVLEMKCRSTPQGCTGFCYRGVTLEPYSDCYSSPGGLCVFTYVEVEVEFREASSCVRDPRDSGCDCSGNYIPLDPPIRSKILVKNVEKIIRYNGGNEHGDEQVGLG